MSLAIRINDVVNSIGADIKSINGRLNATEASLHLYIQDVAPVVTGKYMWLQTNYQSPGGVALWIEDVQT